MTDLTLFDLLLILPVCFVLALAVLWTLDLVLQNRPDVRSLSETPTNTAHFLLQDDLICDQDCRMNPIPGQADDQPATWRDLQTWFGPRFGPLPETLDSLQETKPLVLPALDEKDNATLHLSAYRKARRLQLEDPSGFNPVDIHRTKNMEQALVQYIGVLEHLPCAVAILDEDGMVIWCNRQFSRFSSEEVSCLLEAIPGLPETDRIDLPAEGTTKPQHVQVSYLAQGVAGVLYVTDVTEVAQAETVRREFIQTLTKTFANLTTGLAVFDQHRRLALFNPALLDLTRLPATFLSGQPPLTQFFDRLRDNKMLPEPRNYSTWRHQIDHMITSAKDGLYMEDWSLVDGLTYRVTGRPHPDGAVAFLFEDISDEVAMTRQIRTQLDIRQAALDTMDKAIAVIGADQSILLCNRPCSDFLGIDPDASFADMALNDLMSACQVRLPQEKFWGHVKSAVIERKTLDTVLTSSDGATYHCRVVRIPGKKMKISINPQLDTLPELATELDLPD